MMLISNYNSLYYSGGNIYFTMQHLYLGQVFAGVVIIGAAIIAEGVRGLLLTDIICCPWGEPIIWNGQSFSCMKSTWHKRSKMNNWKQGFYMDLPWVILGH